MKPKISIVIPSFNQGRYIEQTIASVLDQQYPNLELIVIDGGSKDETLSVLKKYENHFAHWESEPDRGQTHAINKGFKYCSGEIFNWLNSDDYYEPAALHEIAEAFKNPSVNVVCGTELAFRDEDPSQTVFHPGTVVMKTWYESVRVGIYTQPCSFMRMSEARKCFPLNESLRYVMDRELWWKYLMRNGQEGVKKIDRRISNFRLHTTSKSVGEQNFFEIEYDALKRSLFKQLQAPEYFFLPLKDQGTQLDIQWPVAGKDKFQILAAFAAYYALRAYVEDDLGTTQKFISFVKKYRGGKLSFAERKMWVMSCIAPHSLVKGLKKIKKSS